MSSMETDDLPVVLPSHTTSTLSISLHPLPILNISEHLMRLKLQQNINSPFVLGALLGTQNGREVDIVNTFELAMDDETQLKVDHGFLVSRKDLYKQVFPSLEFIGWYTVAQAPNSKHITLHEQFTPYTPTPILVVLQPTSPLKPSSPDSTSQSLPLKAYEPTIEIRDRKTRSVFVEAPFHVETGEAERIAVDWTAKGGEGGTKLESHLQTQRAAVQMLHDRILVLVQYVSQVIAGKAKKDHAALRALSALIASLPASENPEFREEFDKEYADVQLTAYLSTLTKSTNALNDLVDKYIVITSSNSRDDRGGARRKGGLSARGSMGMGMGGDWDRYR
ncbi:COP9 signalosome subunit 6 [Rickenella mellea]|uniref:COP9 signalosome complex subunit 6 n=1 Tax=Rickenella mellea TaxID=50990 RepID=A0A4Y7QND8_9AGAM|nr:COP9 signalosome subunit 6 [Rickenella mellea]